MHVLQRAVLPGRTLCSGWPGNSSITVAEDQMGSLIQSGMIKQEGKQTKVSKIRMYVYIYRYIMPIHMYIHMHTLEALKWECAVFKVGKRNVSKCFPDYYWGSSKISFYYFSCFFFSFKMIQYMPPRWLIEKKYFPRKPNDLGLILETMCKARQSDAHL